MGANIFLILTDVENALLDFGKDTERPIGEMTVDKAKKYHAEGHFKAGSMGPKVEAAWGFVERGGERTIITSLNKAVDALKGITGTHIVSC